MSCSHWAMGCLYQTPCLSCTDRILRPCYRGEETGLLPKSDLLNSAGNNARRTDNCFDAAGKHFPRSVRADFSTMSKVCLMLLASGAVGH